MKKISIKFDLGAVTIVSLAILASMTFKLNFFKFQSMFTLAIRTESNRRQEKVSMPKYSLIKISKLGHYF